MGIEYSPGQRKALDVLVKWWQGDEQEAAMAGLAGTGKSTVISGFMDEIGLSYFSVATLAYTGKAAMVLQRKGNNGRTIHSILYDLIEEDVLDREGKVVDKKKNWVKKPMIDANYKLLIVDECSMLDRKVIGDLRSFGVRILYVGDPGQLPPIEKEIDDPYGVYKRTPSGYQILKEAEASGIFLTEIHRQAEGNPIIMLSMRARNGQPIYPGTYGRNAIVIPKSDVQKDPNLFLKADVILVGKNDTRKTFNSHVRYQLGLEDCLLPAKGEKLICTKNDWNSLVKGTPLVNGLTGYCLKDVTEVDEWGGWFKLDFRPDFFEEGDPYFKDLKACLYDFEDEPALEAWKKRKHAHFDFGYAMTVHKSQGSEFPNAFIYDERFGKTDEERNAHLYTGITRAGRNVVLAI